MSVLTASKREDLTRSNTKALRANGQVPGVVYGKGKETQTIAVSEIELTKVLRSQGRNAIFKLELGSDNQIDVMFHDYQMDPIKNEMVHVDLYAADMSEELNVTVPVRVEGENKQGVVQQPLFELQVRAKPKDIPEEIVVEVSSLKIGDVITVSEIPVTGNYEILDAADEPVVSVLAPDSAKSEEHAEEVGEAEPTEGE